MKREKTGSSALYRLRGTLNQCACKLLVIYSLPRTFDFSALESGSEVDGGLIRLEIKTSTTLDSVFLRKFFLNSIWKLLLK
jgi:hypothetical protein